MSYLESAVRNCRRKLSNARLFHFSLRNSFDIIKQRNTYMKSILSYYHRSKNFFKPQRKRQLWLKLSGMFLWPIALFLYCVCSVEMRCLHLSSSCRPRDIRSSSLLDVALVSADVSESLVSSSSSPLYLQFKAGAQVSAV